MTDSNPHRHGDDTEHDHAMTDHDDTDDTDRDAADDPNVFRSKTTRKFGERGSPVIDEEEEITDVSTMDEKVEKTEFSFCNCGSSHVNVDEIYRCCNCDRFACSNCRIRIRRYNYCPDCVQAEYDLTRDRYKTLYRLEHGTLAPADLVATDTVDGEVVTITIDPAADPLLDHGYIQHPGEPDADQDENAVTEAGKEALHAGEQLWGDDPDIEQLKEQVQINRITDR